MPQCHKVHKEEYNASVQKRGDIFFFTKEENTAKLSGNTQYDDACIIMARHIKYTFQIRDYCIKNHHESIVVAMDSTGKHINVSDWHRKMTAKERRYSGKDRYRKVHIMMDLNKRQTIDVKVTPAYRKGTGDCSVGQEFVESIPEKVRTVIADGAYCTKTIHRTCYKNDIERILISPSRTHLIDETGGAALTQYNDALEDIRREPLWDDDRKKPQDII